jgi:hypothetical protein
MNTRALLIVTALVELGAGAALLAVPSLVAEFLLGERLNSPQALVVARVAAFALISLAVACWLARNREHRAQNGLIAGMLIYNLAVPILLIHGWMAAGLDGLGLLPACFLHTLLAAWCIVRLFKEDS